MPEQLKYPRLLRGQLVALGADGDVLDEVDHSLLEGRRQTEAAKLRLHGVAELRQRTLGQGDRLLRDGPRPREVWL